SVAGPGTAIALSKYRRKSSRPFDVRRPTRAPKSMRVGEQAMKASGKTTSFAPRCAASAVRSRIFASVAFVSNTTGELCTTAATNGLDIADNREQYRRKAMKTLLLLVITFGLPVIAFAQTAGQEVTLTGTLRGGRIAIRGGTTAWR